MITTNQYYRVTTPFRLYINVGITGSNTYFGSSQAPGTVWKQIETKPGAELHLLAGGPFYVTAAEEAWECRVELSDKHPFEKVYVPREQPWPLTALQEIPSTEEHIRLHYPTYVYKQRFTAEELAEAGASRYGRGIDYVIPLDFDFEVTLAADLDSQESPRAAAEAAAEWLLNRNDGAGQASYHLRDKLTGRVWAVDLRQPPETDHVVSVDHQNPKEGG